MTIPSPTTASTTDADAPTPPTNAVLDNLAWHALATVHAHLAALQDKGYLRRDPSKPRAIEVTLEPSTGADVDRRPARACRAGPPSGWR